MVTSVIEIFLCRGCVLVEIFLAATNRDLDSAGLNKENTYYYIARTPEVISGVE